MVDVDPQANAHDLTPAMQDPAYEVVHELDLAQLTRIRHPRDCDTILVDCPGSLEGRNACHTASSSTGDLACAAPYRCPIIAVAREGVPYETIAYLILTRPACPEFRERIWLSSVQGGGRMRLRKPSSVQVGVDLRFLQISGTWEPNENERKAAWELYVELITRVSAVPLGPDDGLLREALSSLYSLFATTRDILRRYGPVVAEAKPRGQYSFGTLAVAMLNRALRPVLARWHPALQDWESMLPDGKSRGEHERAWDRAAELRAVLEECRELLSQYARLMAAACGVPDILDSSAPDVSAAR